MPQVAPFGPHLFPKVVFVLNCVFVFKCMYLVLVRFCVFARSDVYLLGPMPIFVFCFFAEGPADLEKHSRKVDSALHVPKHAKQTWRWKTIQHCKRVLHHRISTHMHWNPPHVQQGGGGRPANAMQMHSSWKQMHPVKQNGLPARSRPGLVLKAPRKVQCRGDLRPMPIWKLFLICKVSELFPMPQMLQPDSKSIGFWCFGAPYGSVRLIAPDVKKYRNHNEILEQIDFGKHIENWLNGGCRRCQEACGFKSRG